MGASKAILMLLCFQTILLTPSTSQNYIDFKKNKARFIASALIWSGIKSYGWAQGDQLLLHPAKVHKSALWKIDHGALQQSSTTAARMTDGLVAFAVASPILANIFQPHKNDIRVLLHIGLQGFFVENSLNQLTKLVARRPRPGVYKQSQESLQVPLHPNSLRSFYSGHASTATYFAFLTAKLIHDGHPARKGKSIVWLGSASFALITAHLRYQSGKHFPTDIITGTLVGAASGVLVPELMKSSNAEVSIGANGIAFRLTW